VGNIKTVFKEIINAAKNLASRFASMILCVWQSLGVFGLDWCVRTTLVVRSEL
jgi:hypothetical protein